MACTSIHEDINPDPLPIQNIEEGLSRSEHVTLRFQGSNCPGCITEISAALDKMENVHNANINATLMRIDFEMDLTKSSTSDVISSIQKSTGRPLQRIGDGLQRLDMLSPVVGGGISNVALPLGIKDVTRKGKDTYCVRYDPRLIGARQVLKTLSRDIEDPAILLPPISHDNVPPDIRMSACKTSLSLALTCPILVLAWAPLPSHPITYGAVSLALASVIQIAIAGPFCARALRNFVRNWRIDMDILICLSTSLAYAFSVASFICEVKQATWSSGLYFETSALLITFIMMGRLMSDYACYRALESVPIKGLQPQRARLVDRSNALGVDALEIDARLLQFGDTFIVKSDCPVATDGQIVSGGSEFDESVVTGEASLVKRVVGATVIAGSINRGEDVLVQLTRLPGQNTIDEVAGLVEAVTQSKPRVQQIADRVASWIVPAVGLLGLLTLGTWSLVGAFALHKSIGSAVLDAVSYTIAVLVVTCPCALILAVPIVLIVASSVGVREGIVFTSAEALQVARNITHVVFDKTGTLTDENLSVVSEEYSSESRNLTAALVLALTLQSEHPVSCAITKHLESASFVPAFITEVESVVGNGMKCMWNDQVVKVGNPQWLGVEETPSVQNLRLKNLSILCVTQNGLLIATYGLKANLRKDASSVVARLKERGLSISILSGDENGPVHDIACELNIPQKNTKARCTPLDKQQYIKDLIDKHGNATLFCGDGINDAAALTQASLGLQIWHGNNTAGIAHNTANAILLTPSLSGIPVLLDLSADAHRLIIFSLLWAAVYNVFAILLAAGAFVKVRLPAEYAGLGEAVSVLPVILVPFCLKWKTYT